MKESTTPTTQLADLLIRKAEAWGRRHRELRLDGERLAIRAIDRRENAQMAPPTEDVALATAQWDAMMEAEEQGQPGPMVWSEQEFGG